MTIEGESHRLKPLPDDLVGRAIRDKKFRDEVLRLKDNKNELNAYLVTERFAELTPAAYNLIKSLNPDDVNRTLAEIDAEGFKALAG